MAESAWQRRNENARAKGYRNYYDYRVHRYGKLPATSPVPERERSRLRGHRSLKDLERQVRTGRVSLVTIGDTGERDPQTGQYAWVELVTMDRKGNQTGFRLRGRQASQANLTRLRRQLDAAGIAYVSSPSLGIFTQAAAA